METQARVLYIDDDPGLARLVRRTLEAAGHALEHAASGEDGLSRIARGGIDVVALDHHLPGRSGLDVLQAIRAEEGAPPVIYVTGSEDSRVAIAALKAGAADYVLKDVAGHFRDLLVEVHVAPHPFFGRSGNDLTVRVPVDFADAALGAEISVPTLDGPPVTLRIKPGTQPGSRHRVRGRGIAGKKGTGDLIVTVDVRVPTSLTEAERSAIEQLAAARVEEPAP